MLHPLTLLSPTQYVRDATTKIKQAKTRISFLSMVITDDEATDQLIDALTAAAKRGVRVDVAADMFTYSELSGVFIPSHYYSKRVRAATRMARELSSSGVHFHWLGRLNVTTFSGRTHSKWCVVDDTVYSFGGVNLYSMAIKNNDYMFRVKDAALAERLATELQRINRADRGRYNDRSWQFPFRRGTVYIDSGLVGNSIIYRRACQLAAQSTRILFVSQYCPTGKLSRLLKQHQAELYFNPWTHARGFNRLVIHAGMLLSQQQTRYSRETYLHAKFIIFTLKNGQKIALTGSHNFVHGSVLMGTREIALETSNSHVIRQLETFFKKHVS